MIDRDTFRSLTDRLEGLTRLEEDYALIEREGWQVAITVSHGEHPSFNLSVPKPRLAAKGAMRLKAPPTISFSREDTTTRLGKRLGLDREAQSGHARFDERVYIGADDVPAAYVRAALKQDALRASVEHLLDANGYDHVGTHEGSLLAHAIASQAPPNARRLERDVSALLALARALPKVRYEGSHARMSPQYFIMAIAALMIGGSMMLAGHPAITPVESGTLSARALVALSLWLPSVLLITALARGRAHALRYIMEALVVIGISASILAWSLAPKLNTMLDAGAPEWVEARVLYKEIRHSSGRNNRTHEIPTASLIAQDDSFELHNEEVSQALYDALPEQGQPVTLLIRRGAFRVRWIAAVAP